MKRFLLEQSVSLDIPLFFELQVLDYKGLTLFFEMRFDIFEGS
jgi:hypothetical protein